jgi:nitrogen-specific signal transduction histidine kinase
MTINPKEFQDETGELDSTKDKPVEDKERAAIQQVVVTLSHGINNPLAGILGSIEVLLRNEHGLPAEAREVLLYIKQEAEKIRNIMCQLKDLKILYTTSYLKDNTQDIKMIDLDH